MIAVCGPIVCPPTPVPGNATLEFCASPRPGSTHVQVTYRIEASGDAVVFQSTGTTTMTVADIPVPYDATSIVYPVSFAAAGKVPDSFGIAANGIDLCDHSTFQVGLGKVTVTNAASDAATGTLIAHLVTAAQREGAMHQQSADAREQLKEVQSARERAHLALHRHLAK